MAQATVVTMKKPPGGVVRATSQVEDLGEAAASQKALTKASRKTSRKIRPAAKEW